MAYIVMAHIVMVSISLASILMAYEGASPAYSSHNDTGHNYIGRDYAGRARCEHRQDHASSVQRDWEGRVLAAGDEDSCPEHAGLRNCSLRAQLQFGILLRG